VGRRWVDPDGFIDKTTRFAAGWQSGGREVAGWPVLAVNGRNLALRWGISEGKGERIGMANRDTRRRLEKAELALESLRKYLVDTDESASEGQRHKWSIPDRKIALKYLLAVKQGMEPRQWAQLHPAEWARLIEIAPLKRRDSQPTW
jgi:hypothetical protein